MATIYTRATKGSALTWTEGDANITNLNNDKIELTDLSVGAEGTASGDGSISYNNATGVFTYTPPVIPAAGISNVVEDTTPQLGGSLDVNGQSIVSTSDGNIVLEPNGTGDVYLNADTVRVGDSNATATITTNGTGSLTLNTNGGTNSGTITIAQGANGNIQLFPNGTGQSRLIRFAYTSEAVHNIGTTSGTVNVTGSDANVQTMTLDGNLTLAISSIGAGYSVTLLINTNGTGRTISYVGTWRFAGGEKTLSTTNTTDILSVFFDGSIFWASLSKGFVA